MGEFTWEKAVVKNIDLKTNEKKIAFLLPDGGLDLGIAKINENDEIKSVKFIGYFDEEEDKIPKPQRLKKVLKKNGWVVIKGYPECSV